MLPAGRGERWGGTAPAVSGAPRAVRPPQARSPQPLVLTFQVHSLALIAAQGPAPGHVSAVLNPGLLSEAPAGRRPRQVDVMRAAAAAAAAPRWERPSMQGVQTMPASAGACSAAHTPRDAAWGSSLGVVAPHGLRWVGGAKQRPALQQARRQAQPHLAARHSRTNVGDAAIAAGKRGQRQAAAGEGQAGAVAAAAQRQQQRGRAAAVRCPQCAPWMAGSPHGAPLQRKRGGGAGV